MRLAVLLTVSLLLLAGLSAQSAPVDPQGPFVPRTSILIRSDADFTTANGVVAGTGAADDPFVIAGWHISAGSGTAIRVTNVTSAFVIRDNILTGYAGVHIHAAAAVGVVTQNQILPTNVGVRVEHADAIVIENAIQPSATTYYHRASGVSLLASNSVVEANLMNGMLVGIKAEKGAPTIRLNDLHACRVGVDLGLTIGAIVEANIVTAPSEAGVYLNWDIGAQVIANNITTSAKVGIEVWANKDVEIHNNSIRYSAGAGILVETSSGNITGNLVLDGKVDAMVIWHSPLLIANNTIHNNLGIGLHFQNSGATAEGNVIIANGLGIALHSADVVHLRANVLMNNTVGISIPYEARQAILQMEANFVNGVNVDGTVTASEKVFFYKAANVTITGQVRDSGFSAGFYGSLTAQGGVVLYEVDTANIEASVISHHNVGVGIVNSFNVNVRGSHISNTHVGIRAEGRTVPFQVPDCVVFVKDTNVTIDVDPVGTLGIHARACGAFVLDTNVSLVDTGIRFEAVPSGAVLNGSVTSTTAVGLQVVGGGHLNVSGNVVAHNAAGVRLTGFRGDLYDNLVLDNRLYGVRLESGTEARMVGNNVTRNGEGVIDTRACLGPGTCSSIDAEANVYYANRGVGLRVNGTSAVYGDAFLANRGDGAALGSATIVGVEARGNGGDGIVAIGSFTMRDSLATQNVGHGFRLVGEGSIRSSEFVRNQEAGIHATALHVTALQLNVSDNLDGILFNELVPRLATPGSPSVDIPRTLGVLPALLSGPDPLVIHLSVIERNLRDGIRAGGAAVDATHNYFGPLGPRVNVADTVGAFGNGVSPTVRFVPWYSDPDMTTTGPLPFL